MTYRLGKPLAKVDMYAMVNLIAGRRIVRELIQDACTPAAVADEAVALLTDVSRRDQMVQDLAAVRAALGGPGASQRAADAVIDLGPARPRVEAAGRSADSPSDREGTRLPLHFEDAWTHPHLSRGAFRTARRPLPSSRCRSSNSLTAQLLLSTAAYRPCMGSGRPIGTGSTAWSRSTSSTT